MANKLSQFKPSITIDGKTTYCNRYAEIKKCMYSLLNESDSKTATVVRSRRGKWGEWFEHWSFNSKNNPVITEQGWM